MSGDRPRILALNAGSTSIRFAIYATGDTLERGVSGTVDRIGQPGMRLRFADPEAGCTTTREINLTERGSAVEALVDWLEIQPAFSEVRAVGHRVVHGMERTEPERVTPGLLSALDRLRPYDPEHLPREIELMMAFERRHAGLPQVACFDTAFHAGMPRVARLLPLPRRYDARGVRRYGFHGLSYAYLLEELGRLGDPAATAGRVILGHLGGGASLAAVRDGRSIDTSMGFTPTAGLMMGTRSGDLDPGLASFFTRAEHFTVDQFDRMIHHESGLLGVSETSSDMRDLLELRSRDVRAAEAVELFCYQAKKGIGAFAAVLGGLDTLVFAGGIGENAPFVRARICEGLGFLGVELDEALNGKGAGVISSDISRVTVRVLRTDEEIMIARSVLRSCPGMLADQDRRPGMG